MKVTDPANNASPLRSESPRCAGGIEGGFFTRLLLPFLLVSLCFCPGDKPPAPNLTLAFVGDVMLGRGVAHLIREDGDWTAAFAAVQPYLSEADLTVANLESLLTDAPIVSDGYDLRAPPGAAIALQTAGFDAVSLANNHARDAGKKGLRETIDTLTSANIIPILPPTNHIKQSSAYQYTILALDDSITPLDLEAAASAVARTAKQAVVIVSIHWGGEYQAAPGPRQRAVAARLARAGATVIVGHGPHVLQRIEWIGDTLVAYSLGNFLFDQSYPVDCRWGAILHVTLQGHHVTSVTATPTVTEQGHVHPAPLKETTAILNRLNLPNTDLPLYQYTSLPIPRCPMNFVQAVLLGIIQGATEFLPVSSSGHLVLVPWLLNWPAPGLAFDAVVHWGTAAAVIVYFWRDWIALVRAIPQALKVRPYQEPQDLQGSIIKGWNAMPPDARLLWLIVLGTIPAAVIGYALEDFFEAMFARPAAAAGFLLATAALLTISEHLRRRERDIASLNGIDALLVGFAQAMAIFPGISRSGATIAAGLGRQLKREAAARFSFLLATPIILGAGLLKIVDLIQMGGLAAQAPTLIVGFLVAALVGLGCIHFLLRYLQQHRLYPFAIYCTAAGLVCLLVALLRGT